MPLPSEAKLAGAYKLEWLRQRRKESHLAQERRTRARAAEQLQEFAQEFEPALGVHSKRRSSPRSPRLEFAPRWAWEQTEQAKQQAEAGQAGQAEAEAGQAEAGLLTQRREWEEGMCHQRQLSLEASERTDPER